MAERSKESCADFLVGAGDQVGAANDVAVEFGVRQGGDLHAGVLSSKDTCGRVFHDGAKFGRNAESGGGDEEDIGRRFECLHLGIIAAHDVPEGAKPSMGFGFDFVKSCATARGKGERNAEGREFFDELARAGHDGRGREQALHDGFAARHVLGGGDGELESRHDEISAFLVAASHHVAFERPVVDMAELSHDFLDADSVEGLGIQQDTVEVEKNGRERSAQSHGACV